MRRLITLLLSAVALNVAAQTHRRSWSRFPSRPRRRFLNESLEPQVTIIKRGEDKVEEYRMNGKLYMLKVTPPHGVPYYLIDNAGDGAWMRQDSLDSGLRVPMWVIGTFF
jgi:hypothetical protein